MCAAPDAPRAGGAGYTKKRGASRAFTEPEPRARATPVNILGSQNAHEGPAAKFCRGEEFSSPLRARLSVVTGLPAYLVHSTQHTPSMCCRGTLTSPSPRQRGWPVIPGVWGVGFGDLGKPFRDPCGAPAKAQMRRTPLLGGPALHPRFAGLSGLSGKSELQQFPAPDPSGDGVLTAVAPLVRRLPTAPSLLRYTATLTWKLWSPDAIFSTEVDPKRRRGRERLVGEDEALQTGSRMLQAM